MSETCPHCRKLRSSEDHRRFFAVVRAAFDSWPEKHVFEPMNEEHLRSWLICRAGWRDATPIELPDGMTAAMIDRVRLVIEAAIRAAGTHCFLVQHKDAVYVVRPKSIAYGAMGQAEFGALREAVEQVIEAEIGVSAETLLNGAEEAA